MGIFSSDRKETNYNTTSDTDSSSFEAGIQVQGDNEGDLYSIGMSDSSNNIITSTDYGSVSAAINLSGNVVNKQTELSKLFLTGAENLALKTNNQALSYNENATKNALEFASNSLKPDQGETAGLLKWVSGLAALALVTVAFVKGKK